LISGTLKRIEKFIPELGRHFLCTSNPVLDENGNIKRIIVIIEQLSDVTEKKKIDEMLHQARKMESIDSLAGGIAHDFNNLLFPIVGLSEMMLADFPPDSPEHNNLHEIFLAGKRGRELVLQILSFSRQSEQKLIPIHIQRVLKEVFKLCRATIPTDIPISRDIQTDCGPVMADPTCFDLIITDMNMPYLSGMQFAEKLVAVKPEIPISSSAPDSVKESTEKKLKPWESGGS
jgi:signal transduction histidine kinase